MIEIDRVYTFKELSDFMHARYRKHVVERALAYSTKSHNGARNELEAALRHRIKIAGHRNALAAPPDTLLGPVASAFRKHDDVVRAVIRLWMEAEAGLRSKVEAFLLDQDLLVLHTLPVDSFNQTWSKAEMIELTQKFHEAEPGYGFDDVALMLCCLLGRGPTSRSQMFESDEFPNDETEEATLSDYRTPELDHAAGVSDPEPKEDASNLTPHDQLQETIAPNGGTSSDGWLDSLLGALEESFEKGAPQQLDLITDGSATFAELLTGVATPAGVIVPEATVDTAPQEAEELPSSPTEDVAEHEILRATYQSLFQQLDQARDLVALGDFAALKAWLDHFQEQVTQIASAFDDLRERVISQLAEFQRMIVTEVAAGDAAPFSTAVDDVFGDLSGSPLAHCDAVTRAGEIEQKLAAYQARLQKAREAVNAGVIKLEDGLQLARLWQLSNAQWLTVRRRLPEPGAPVAIWEETAQILTQTQQQILEAIEHARRDLISSQQVRCQDIQVKLDLMADKAGHSEILAEFEPIVAALENHLDDIMLLRIPERLDSVQAWTITPEIDSELTQAAITYTTGSDQFNLEYLLDLLWSRDRLPEAFMIFTMALRSGRWQSGASLPENGLSKYFGGLVAVTPLEQIPSAAMELCAGGLLANALGLERADEKLGLLMLYAAGLSARPGALPVEDLWRLRDTTAAPADSDWIRLAERLMEGDQPDILSKEQTDFSSITEIEARLNEEFRRDGGKYAHLAGSGSKALLNMEQKHLMPSMEGYWRDIQRSSPAHKDWPKLKNEIENLDPAEIFERFCRAEGLSTDVNRFFEEEYNKRLGTLADLLCEYAQQRTRQHELTVNPPVTWEELTAELNEFAPKIGTPLGAVVGALLQEARNAQDVSISTWQATGEALEQRVAHVLLTDTAIPYSLSSAVAWLGRKAADTEEMWGEWLDAAIQGLSLPPDINRIIAAYQEADLPLLARAVAQAAGQTGAVRRATEQLGRLQQTIAEREARLRELGSAVSATEQAWWNEGRFGLALGRMGNRIEQLEVERKREQQRRQDALKQLYRDVSELEPAVAESDQMPDATRTEAFAALADVRAVSLNKHDYRLVAAQDVLKEIRRMLTYPGATAEGLAQQVERLRTTTQPRQVYKSDASGLKEIPSLAAMVRSLREGDLAQLGLRAGVLSEKQREDRAEMLELWQRIATLPMEAELSADDQAAMQRCASLFAFTTWMFMQPGNPPDIAWSTTPIPVFETRLTRPRTAALKRGVALVFVTGETINRRQLRILDGLLQEQHWLREGWFVVLMAPLVADTLTDWVRRNRPTDPIVVLDEKTIQEVVISADNPSATGRLRRALLRVAGPARFDVFKFENLVDPDQEIYVGRKDWQVRLVDSEQSHAVYGGRRIGKSSLLNAVSKELRVRGVRTAYISLEGVDIKDREGLLICDQILQKLGIGQTCSSFGDFKTKMTSFFVGEPSARITILLDEADSYIKACAPTGQAHKLIHTLRGLYQEQHGRCRFIIAGFIELWRQLNIQGDIAGQDSPWFNFLQDNGPLGGLSENDAQNIVRQGFQETLGMTLASSNIASEVIECTTTHPAFVQKFCAQLHIQLHNIQSDRLTSEDIKSVFKDRKERNFLEFVNATLRPNLNPLPRLIVLLLAAEGTEKFTINDIKEIAQSYDNNQVLGSLADRQWSDSLDELRITSVIRRVQVPNTYQFSVPSYPVILREFEEANQNEIIDLIHEIVGKAVS